MSLFFWVKNVLYHKNNYKNITQKSEYEERNILNTFCRGFWKRYPNILYLRLKSFFVVLDLHSWLCNYLWVFAPASDHPCGCVAIALLSPTNDIGNSDILSNKWTGGHTFTHSKVKMLFNTNSAVSTIIALLFNLEFAGLPSSKAHITHPIDSSTMLAQTKTHLTDLLIVL